MEVGLLSTFASQLGDTSHRLTITLALLDLILQHLCHIAVDMEIVIHLLLYEVTNIFIYADTLRRHHSRTQLNLRLTLEDRFLDIDGDSCNDTSTDIAILILIEELLDGSCDVLLKGTLMSTALSSMLSVDKRIILLTILISMSKGNLYVVTLKMDDRI